MEKLKVKEVVKLIYDFDEDHYVISGGASGKHIKKLAENIVELIKVIDAGQQYNVKLPKPPKDRIIKEGKNPPKPINNA